MKTVILISTYNWPKALDKVLQSVSLQTVFPSEILIADDGSTQETTDLINSWRNRLSIPIHHVWQEDEGFRKTQIVNKTIKASKADYIIQIDGDIILDPFFIEDHVSEAKKKQYIRGSRALISPQATEHIVNSESLDYKYIRKNIKNKINAIRNMFLSKLLSKNSFRSDNLKACNFSFWKADYIEANGYNNDMNGWGHEDIELAARIVNNGTEQRKLKNKAVCYHLHHEYFDKKDERTNLEIYNKVVETKSKTCLNGYNQVTDFDNTLK